MPGLPRRLRSQPNFQSAQHAWAQMLASGKAKRKNALFWMLVRLQWLTILGGSIVGTLHGTCLTVFRPLCLRYTIDILSQSSREDLGLAQMVGVVLLLCAAVYVEGWLMAQVRNLLCDFLRVRFFGMLSSLDAFSIRCDPTTTLAKPWMAARKRSCTSQSRKTVDAGVRRTTGPTAVFIVTRWSPVWRAEELADGEREEFADAISSR